MRNILTLLLACALLSSKAQQTVIIYGGLSAGYPLTLSSRNVYGPDLLGIAYTKQHEKKYTEYGLQLDDLSSWLPHLDLSGLSSASPANMKQMGVRLYVEKGRMISTLGKNKQVRFLLGSSTNPFFAMYKKIPTITSDFPVEVTSIGLEWAVIPHAQIQLSNHFSLDANMMLPVLKLAYTSQHNHNQTLLPEAQRYGILDFDIPLINSNNPIFKIGLAYQLN